MHFKVETIVHGHYALDDRWVHEDWGLSCQLSPHFQLSLFCFFVSLSGLFFFCHRNTDAVRGLFEEYKHNFHTSIITRTCLAWYTASASMRRRATKIDSNSGKETVWVSSSTVFEKVSDTDLPQNVHSTHSTPTCSTESSHRRRQGKCKIRQERIAAQRDLQVRIAEAFQKTR